MAAEALTDQEKQFRKRARRRLIGAIALVLLMVTVLPMLLDDRSDQAPHPEVAISIPSQDDGNFASKIVPVTPATPAPPAATPEPQPVQLASPIEPAPANPEPKPAAEPKPAPEAKPEIQASPAPAVEPKAEPKKAEPKPEPKAEKPEPAKPVIKVEPKPEVKHPPKPKPEAAKVEKTEPAKAEGVSVQIGVFSDSAKVAQVKGKIADLGIKCGTEQLDTKNGVKIRLRCGPYKTRADAEAAQGSLKTAGFGNTILVTHQ